MEETSLRVAVIFVMDDDGDLGVAAAFPNPGVKFQCATCETGTFAAVALTGTAPELHVDRRAGRRPLKGQKCPDFRDVGGGEHLRRFP